MINPLAGYTYIGPVSIPVSVSTGAGPGVANITAPVVGLKAGDLVSVVSSDTDHLFPFSNAIASDGSLTFSIYYNGAVNTEVTFVANVSRPENSPLPTVLEI